MQPDRQKPTPDPARKEEFWVDLPAPVSEAAAGIAAGMGPSFTDPEGSWTGLPLSDELETPVQDADDL